MEIDTGSPTRGGHTSFLSPDTRKVLNTEKLSVAEAARTSQRHNPPVTVAEPKGKY
jgi:hypothetical protein